MHTLSKETEAAVLQVYHAGWAAYYRGDLDAYADALSEDYRVVGTSEGENFDSKQEWLDYCHATLDQFSGVLRMENQRFQVLPAGELVLVVEKGDAWVQIENEWRYYGPVRISTLLRSEAGEWKFYHQHGSFPDSRANEGEVIAARKIQEENELLKEAVKRRTAELEHKNRELSIEASLEKVRAVAMGMKKADDLLDITVILFKEFESLGFTSLRNVLIHKYIDEEGLFLDYDFSPFTKGVISRIPYTGNPIIENFIRDIRKSNDAFTEVKITGEELEDWKKFRIQNNEAPDERLDNIDALYYYNYSIGDASIGISTFAPVSDDQIRILKRFRNVFDLSYRRYVDISKAEAQAREVEIELALERVRAGTMSMRRSSDLLETSTILDRQVRDLGIKTFGCAFNIFDEDEESSTEWFSNAKGYVSTYRIPRIGVFKKYFDERWNEKQLHVEEFSADACAAHYKFLSTLPGLAEEMKVYAESGVALPEIQYDNVAYFKYGYLLFVTYEPVPESHEIFKRFAKVFEQAYTRFLDLQKAEQQAREAQINLAVERVRARALAMFKSEEIIDVVMKLKDEIIGLQIPSVAAATIHLREPDGRSRIWDITFEEKIGYNHLMDIIYDLDETDPGFFMRRIWAHQEKYFVEIQDRNDFPHTLQWLRDHGRIEQAEETEKLLQVYNIERVYHATAQLMNGRMSIDLFEPPAPEMESILEKMSAAFDLAYKRFEDLKNSEAQLKEAKVEAALERIRTSAMVMRTSKDLQLVADTLHLQLSGLDQPELESSVIHLYSDNSDVFDVWYTYTSARTGKVVKGSTKVHKDSTAWTRKALEGYHSGASTYVIESRGEMLEEWYHQLEIAAPETLDYSDDGQLIIPPVLYYHFSRFSGGALLIITECPLSKESRDLQIRAARVFNLAYQRFEDLLKAESQAREAQIEAALDRVRSIAMSMMKSDDLPKVCESVFVQLSLLGFDRLRSSQIYLRNDEEGKFLNYDYSTEKGSATNQVKYDSNPNTYRLYTMISTAGDGLHEHAIDKNELEEWKSYLFNTLGMPPEKAFDDAEELNYYLYSFGMGAFGISTFRKINQDELQILKRFRNVFSLSYQRYSDIAQAEDQAREARIELSLERVRAKAMAMHSTRDLADTIGVFYGELKTFSIAPIRCGVGLLDGVERMGEMYTWNTTDKGESLELVGKLYLAGHPILEGVYQGWLSQTEYFPVLRGNEIRDYYSFLKPQISFPDYEDDVVQYGHFFFFKEGGVYAWTRNEMKEDELQIYRRFTKVLSLTYKRFRDLQQAEKNTREAQIEAALEKVRSRTLAMQKSDELVETAAVLFQQLIGLGIEPNRLYISTIKDDKGTSEFWITDEDGSKVSTAYVTNMNDNPTFLKMYEGWKQQLKSLVIDMHGDELTTYFNHLTSIGVPFKGGLKQKRRVQDIAYFSHGFIGIASHEEQPVETLQLLERFAYVFNLTYTRFNDLKLAEAHALKAEQDLVEIKAARKKAEEALTELQLTQGQLIQKEKMASLGELTAGIAHEIQNPLNFVNNFSEVSAELIDEVEQAIVEAAASEETSERSTSIVELLTEIKQNLSKINHHGKRADAIVKGMLQHSRQAGGEKVETSLNAFCDEWVRLAYHGFRAKDHQFNADIQTDFDERIHRVKIIPQDLGRVILNLLNNSFYAVSEKEKQHKKLISDAKSGMHSASGNKAYQPLVRISTKQIGKSIEITVKDNGNGIPKGIVDKIFQPFFTTKPTGQGTGLGLSLSYDIITQGHGGDLRVTTVENESTEFVIQLPS